MVYFADHPIELLITDKFLGFKSMTDWTAIRTELLGSHPKSVLPPTLKLPMLPRALSDFTRQAQDPNADPRELSKIIETDSGLSSELLRHVNSCTVGVKSKVKSVHSAGHAGFPGPHTASDI